MKKQNHEEWEKCLDKRAQKRDAKRKMKVSGGGVKNLQKIIIKRKDSNL